MGPETTGFGVAASDVGVVVTCGVAVAVEILVAAALVGVLTAEVLAGVAEETFSVVVVWLAANFRRWRRL